MRWVKIGRYPTITTDEARSIAKAHAVGVARGEDPAAAVRTSKEAPLVGAALDIFFDEYVVNLKAKSIIAYKGIIKRLKANIGSSRIDLIQHSNITKLHHSMRDAPYMANLTIRFLSGFFNWCERRGLREANANPCKGVSKYREQARKDFMGPDMLSSLGEALALLERQGATPPYVGAIIRLLIFTGARSGEIMALEWDMLDIDKGVAYLPDSKTGHKTLQLTLPAVEVLKNIPRDNVSKWVFPASTKSGHVTNIHSCWKSLLKQAGLQDTWRLHDLRHSFASMMVNSGSSLPMVSKILGHSNIATTERYAHIEVNPARQAAEQAAIKIAEAMSKNPQRAEIIPLNKFGKTPT